LSVVIHEVSHQSHFPPEYFLRSFRSNPGYQDMANRFTKEQLQEFDEAFLKASTEVTNHLSVAYIGVGTK
jgi:hypothetical protein